MNAKQSLKRASARIMELEDFNKRASAEIKALNACIDSVISGEKTYCDWCEEQQECQRNCKGTGCSEWWMKMEPADFSSHETSVLIAEGGAEDSEGARLLSPGPTGRE